MPPKLYIPLSSLTGYQLGILWAIANYDPTDNYLLCRYQVRYFLEQIQLLRPTLQIQESQSRTGPQYRLKMSGLSLDELFQLGWTPRNANERNVPPLDDYRDFLRAWIEIHGRVKYGSHPEHKELKKIKMQIYGNRILMQSINNILVEYAGVAPKKLSSATPNHGKTSILAYQSAAEIERVLWYIEGDPCYVPFWDAAFEMVRNPVISK